MRHVVEAIITQAIEKSAEINALIFHLCVLLRVSDMSWGPPYLILVEPDRIVNAAPSPD